MHTLINLCHSKVLKQNYSISVSIIPYEIRSNLIIYKLMPSS